MELINHKKRVKKFIQKKKKRQWKIPLLIIMLKKK